MGDSAMTDHNRRVDDVRIGEILRKIQDQDNREKERIEAQERLWDAKLAPITELLKVHNRTLFGDGTDGYPGLHKKVDRMEQIEVRRKWHFGVLYTAIVSGAIKAVYDWLAGAK